MGAAQACCASPSWSNCCRAWPGCCCCRPRAGQDSIPLGLSPPLPRGRAVPADRSRCGASAAAGTAPGSCSGPLSKCLFSGNLQKFPTFAAVFLTVTSHSHIATCPQIAVRPQIAVCSQIAPHSQIAKCPRIAMCPRIGVCSQIATCLQIATCPQIAPPSPIAKHSQIREHQGIRESFRLHHAPELQCVPNLHHVPMLRHVPQLHHGPKLHLGAAGFAQTAGSWLEHARGLPEPRPPCADGVWGLALPQSSPRVWEVRAI